MRLSTILKVLAVLVVAVVVGAIVVLMSVDFNQYKGLIAAKVKEATGRTLVIDGDIELELSLNPALSVSGVRFQNAAWGSRPQMATVESFSAQVALLPLLTKTVEVEHVLLKDADILIERNAEGRMNFEFAAPPRTTKPVEKQAVSEPSSAHSEDLPIPVVRKVLIQNAKLTYIDVASGQKRVVALSEMSVSGDGPSSPVAIAFSMNLDRQPITGRGEIGPLAGLTDPGTDLPITFSLEAGGAKVDVAGKVGNVISVSGLDLAIAVAGNSLATLSPLAGAPVPPIGPYSLSAKIRGGLSTVIEVADIALKMGKSDVSGNLTARLGGARPSVDGRFSSNLIDAADFLKEGGEKSPPTAKSSNTPASGSSGKGSSDGRVIPNTPIPVDALKLVDAKVAFGAKRIVAQGIALQNVDLAVDLKDGRLQLSPLKADLSEGTIDGRVQLDGSQSAPSLSADFKALKVDVGKLLAEAAITDLLEGTINIDVKLKGRGKTVRTLTASLDGGVKAVMGEGRVKTEALDLFIGGPTQVVTKMIVGDKKEYTVLNCVVSQTDISKGIATLTAAAIDTEYAKITGKGKVDLSSEALDVTINPEPKSATLNLAVAVKVGGTLGDPSYGLDELSVLRKLGGTVLGFGFPPALVLGLGELGADGDNPCLKPAAAKGSSKQAPAKQQTSDPITKGVEGAGKLLKGLFGR